jgi:hypothetical protein
MGHYEPDVVNGTLTPIMRVQKLGPFQKGQERWACLRQFWPRPL